MSKRINVQNADNYRLRQNTASGNQNGYYSFEFYFRRNNGDQPGTVLLDTNPGAGSRPRVEENCGCGSSK